MKFIKFCIAITLLSLSSLSAMAVSFTLNISQYAAGLRMSVDNSSSFSDSPLVDGDNDFDIPTGSSFNIYGNGDYKLTGVSCNGASISIYDNYWYMPVTADMDGKTYILSVEDLNMNRNGRCILNIDNASKVNATLKGSSSPTALINGDNILRFNPETETLLYISPKDYNNPIYFVSLNGAPIEKLGLQYTVPLSEDCIIDVLADFPDTDINVNFTYSPGGEGAISKIFINNKEFTDFNGRDIVMKAGQRIDLYADSAFEIQGLSVNGKSVYWTGSYAYSTVTTENTTFHVTATPHPYYSVNIMVDEPANIVLYRGETQYNDVVSLLPGENSIRVFENSPMISWKPTAGSYIVSVTADNNPVSGKSLLVSDGMTISFITGTISMDKEAVIWIDNRNVPYFEFNSADNIALGDDLYTGYNVIPFYDGYLPFNVSWYVQNYTPNALYLDGIELDSISEDIPSYQITPQNGSIVKIFMTTEPEECSITFDVEDGLNLIVFYDIILSLENPAEGLKAFKGTQININGGDDTTLLVTVNNVPVAANEGFSHEFVVSDPETHIEVRRDSQNGITSPENASKIHPVYNLQGVKVCTSDNISALPPGIYIVNGKKMLLK